ncbi:MAG: hypothetical protein AAGI53_16915 [Planctomycetota bacterium]
MSTRLIAPLAALSIANAAFAAPVPILNPGFEADFALPGTFPVGPITDWPNYDPDGIIAFADNFTGVINPSGGGCFNGDDAPEGSNAALLYFNNRDAIGLGAAGIRQELNAALEPDTTYTLTVEVGNIASCAGLPPFDNLGFFDLDGFPGYAVQLVAGGVVVAEDFNTLGGSIPEGEFRTSTVELVVGADHAQLGGVLEIRLLNLNEEDTPEDPGVEVDFDDVRLGATVNATPCNAADLAAPRGVLDLDDIDTFVQAFLDSDASVDFAPPLDVFDLDDIDVFIQAFLSGCP